MTVTTIDISDIYDIVKTHAIGLAGATVHISQEDIDSVTDDMWRYIRNELNAMPDMYYGCVESYCAGEIGKRFHFFSEDEDTPALARDFIEVNIESGEHIPLRDVNVCDLPPTMRGFTGANTTCPLFSK